MKHARADYQRIQDPEGKIGENEPVFLLRATDRVSPVAVEAWAREAARIGAASEIVDAAMSQARAMVAWQHAYGNKVPDL